MNKTSVAVIIFIFIFFFGLFLFFNKSRHSASSPSMTHRYEVSEVLRISRRSEISLCLLRSIPCWTSEPSLKRVSPRRYLPPVSFCSTNPCRCKAPNRRYMVLGLSSRRRPRSLRLISCSSEEKACRMRRARSTLRTVTSPTAVLHGLGLGGVAMLPCGFPCYGSIFHDMETPRSV